MLRRDGRRGRPGSSRERDDRGARADRGAGPSRRRGCARRRSSASRCCSSGRSRVVVFGILRPDTFLTTSNFSTIFGSQAVLVVLTLGAARPADRRRLRPLGRGDADARGDGARDPEREPRLVDLRRRSSPRSRVGAAVGLVNGALVVLFDIDSLIVDARHGRRSSPASCSGSATRRRSAASPTGLVDCGRRRAAARDPARVLLRHRARRSSSGTSSSTRRSGGGCCSSAAGAASRGCRGIRVDAPALGRARRLAA